jgi:hypothetical protein
MSLSFENEKGSIPIAIINDGEMAGQILYVNENEKSIGGSYDSLELIDPKNYKGYKEKQINEVHKSIKQGMVSPDILVNERLKNLYQKSKADIVDKTGKEVKLNNGKFSLIPENIDNQRQVLSIMGPSGVGKSYIAAEYARNFHTLFPKRSIYLFTKKKEDPNFDKLDYIKRVDLACLVECEVPLEELRDSLVIMDDYETLDGEIKKAFYKLKDDILLMGRSYNVPTILINHVQAGGSQTKLDNLESTAYIIYKNGSAKHNKYILSTYLGLNNKDIEKVMKLPSRWVYINRKYPMHVVYEHGAYLI